MALRVFSLLLTGAIGSRVESVLSDQDAHMGKVDKLIKKVKEEALKADYQSIDCARAHFGTLVVGCERAKNLKKRRKMAPVCQLRLLDSDGLSGSSPVLHTALLQNEVSPHWMEAFALDLQCLDAGNSPNRMIEVSVIDQNLNGNSTFGKVMFPLDEVITGEIGGLVNVFLRQQDSDAVFWGAENDTKRFVFSLADIGDNETQDDNPRNPSDYYDTTETTTTLKQKWMSNVGQLTVRLTFCASDDHNCIGNAVAASHGHDEAKPNQRERFRCGQGCDEVLVPALLRQMEEAKTALDKVQGEKNFCDSEKLHGGRCGQIGRAHVMCDTGRCCSKAGWCGSTQTHCPGNDDYSSGWCKVRVEDTASWRKAKTLLQTLPNRMVEEARSQCGQTLLAATVKITKPLEEVMELLFHPENMTELKERLDAVIEAVRVLGETVEHRWWAKKEMIPNKGLVHQPCFKYKWR